MSPKVSEEDLERLRSNLVTDAKYDRDYLVLALSSCFIATCGLLLGSAAIIIGAMIIAPLMLPLRGVALAALEGDWFLFRQSAIAVGLGTIASILLAWTIGRIVDMPESEFSLEILARTQPTLVDLGIAMVAGAVGGYAKIQPKLGDAVAGTAIAVALMPPLCVVGLSLSQASWSFARGSFLLYFTNLLGITLACMLVFIWGGYYVESSRITRAISSTLALTALVVVPLAFSLWQLVRQVQLQSTLKSILLRRTITVGQQAELVQAKFDWGQDPPQVRLQVRVSADDPITAKQVYEVERLVEQEMRQRFELIFEVEQVEQVRSQDTTEDKEIPDSN
mgnify:CR=1 FL=1